MRFSFPSPPFLLFSPPPLPSPASPPPIFARPKARQNPQKIILNQGPKGLRCYVPAGPSSSSSSPSFSQRIHKNRARYVRSLPLSLSRFIVIACEHRRRQLDEVYAYALWYSLSGSSAQKTERGVFFFFFFELTSERTLRQNESARFSFAIYRANVQRTGYVRTV